MLSSRAGSSERTQTMTCEFCRLTFLDCERIMFEHLNRELTHSAECDFCIPVPVLVCDECELDT